MENQEGKTERGKKQYLLLLVDPEDVQRSARGIGWSQIVGNENANYASTTPAAADSCLGWQ